MNDLPTLHDEADKLMFRQLSNELRRLRRRAGDLSKAIEKPTRSAPICIDAAQVADAGSDIGGGQGPTA